MTLLERRMLALAFIFCLLTFSVWTGWLSLTSMGSIWNAPTAQAVSGTFYGANEGWTAQAASDWPQHDPNWCGVANIEMIANYTYQLAANNGYTYPFHSGGQAQIANDLNRPSGVSIWGTAPKTSVGPGFAADIAADGGTDPRSIAWAIAYESASGSYWRQWSQRNASSGSPLHSPPAYTFHNVIYHGSVGSAVAGLARTLERYRIPVSVTIAHGLHSDVVTGVYATSDPINSYPANITGLNVWDPGVGSPWGGYQSAREVTWDTYTFETDANLWGSTYNLNSGYDPDPARGIYTPTSTYPHHWITFRTDIEPDNQVSVSPDMAVDEQFAVMTHP
ncbi:MAG: hypothetical protein ACXWQZ_15105 [Ktedonobacterales bacterium]